MYGEGGDGQKELGFTKFFICINVLQCVAYGGLQETDRHVEYCYRRDFSDK